MTLRLALYRKGKWMGVLCGLGKVYYNLSRQHVCSGIFSIKDSLIIRIAFLSIRTLPVALATYVPIIHREVYKMKPLSKSSEVLCTLTDDSALDFTYVYKQIRDQDPFNLWTKVVPSCIF